MTEHLRWGIMGAGWIAARFASDLRYSANGVLSRVASRDPARAQTFANNFGAQIAEDYASLAALDDVDAIYIATPAHLHCEHCLLALSHGKPVLCEKPLATSADEARRIAEAARDAGTFCMEAMWTRFLPAVTEMRSRVKDGALGAVSQFGAEIGFPHRENSSTATVTSADLGGGALLDLGVYGLSMALDLLGPPESVDAVANVPPSGSIRDVAISMVHRFSGQTAIASVRASHSTLLGNRLDVSGERGRISLDPPFIQAVRFSQTPVQPAERRAAGKPSLIKDRLNSMPGLPLAKELAKRAMGRGFVRQFRGYGLQFEADEVAHCIAASRPESATMPLSQSIAILEIADEIGAIISRKARHPP